MANYTMSDIAKLAGVSKATVSRVLNGSKKTSPEIRKRVLDIVIETGYRPNLLARALTKNESMTIGFIVPSNEDEILSKLIREIEQVFIQEGYRSIVCHTDYDYSKERKCLDELVQNHVDGLIVLTNEENSVIYKDISVPTIMIDQYISGGPITVTTDNYYGGYLAGKRLLNDDRKSIALLKPIIPNVAFNERINGFKKAMDENKMLFETVECQTNYRQCLKNIDKILDIKTIDGIFATNDLLAAYANKLLSKKGIAVPEEVSIIGYGDTTISNITIPSLTTISQNIASFSETVVDYLLSYIQKRPLKKRFIILPIKMVEKGSTKKKYDM